MPSHRLLVSVFVLSIFTLSTCQPFGPPMPPGFPQPDPEKMKKVFALFAKVCQKPKMSEEELTKLESCMPQPPKNNTRGAARKECEAKLHPFKTLEEKRLFHCKAKQEEKKAMQT